MASKINVIQLKTKIKPEDATLGKYENPKLHYFHINVDYTDFPYSSVFSTIELAKLSAQQTVQSAVDFINTNFNAYAHDNVNPHLYTLKQGPIINTSGQTEYRGPYTVTIRGSYQASTISIPSNRFTLDRPAHKCVWLQDIGELYDASTCENFSFTYADGKLEDFLKYTNNSAHWLYLNSGNISGDIHSIFTKMPNLENIYLLYLDNIYGDIGDFPLSSFGSLQRMNLTGSKNIGGTLDRMIERTVYGAQQGQTIKKIITTNDKITLRGINRPNEYTLYYTQPSSTVKQCEITYNDSSIARLKMSGHRYYWEDL